MAKGGLMTWLEYMKYFDNSISNEIAEFILWNETAFPCSDIKTTAYQVRSSIRAGKNKIMRCDLCGYKTPFHQNGCLARQEVEPK
jgi:hypothetical protein